VSSVVLQLNSRKFKKRFSVNENKVTLNSASHYVKQELRLTLNLPPRPLYVACHKNENYFLYPHRCWKGVDRRWRPLYLRSQEKIQTKDKFSTLIDAW